MNITFGILIGNNYDTKKVQNLVDSIENQNLLKENNYEIFIGGNYRNDIFSKKPLKIVSLGDDYKYAWHTRKRNLIAKKAKYEVISYTHDYFIYDKGWYEGLVKFNSEDADWDVLRIKVLHSNGKRLYDWTLFQPYVNYFITHKKPTEKFSEYCFNLDYHIKNAEYLQMIHGASILAKTEKILEMPFIEKMTGWETILGRMEDVWWTHKLACKGYKMKMNTYSTLKFQKEKIVIDTFPSKYVDELIDFFDKEKMIKLYDKNIRKFNL